MVPTPFPLLLTHMLHTEQWILHWLHHKTVLLNNSTNDLYGTDLVTQLLKVINNFLHALNNIVFLRKES